MIELEVLAPHLGPDIILRGFGGIDGHVLGDKLARLGAGLEGVLV